MNNMPANGTRGILINVLGKTMFRVYDKDHNFIDYELHHSDLAVTIDDEDAYFYQHKDRMILDHSPATLGREE
jgi:hypothetical protein